MDADERRCKGMNFITGAFRACLNSLLVATKKMDRERWLYLRSSASIGGRIESFLLRRADEIEMLRAGGYLRVGELELAGQNLRDAAERGPVGHRQGKIRGRQSAEQRAHAVGEGERERKLWGEF